MRLRAREDGGLSIQDPVTRRSFAFDDVQGAVARELDGVKSARQIAQAVFEVPDPVDEVPLVEGFALRLGSLGLLDEGERNGVGKRQSETLRALAREDRDERVRRVASWAGASIPFYRERFGSLAADVRGLDDLRRLPTMTRSDIRDNFPGRLLPDGVNAAELVTSGEVWLYSTSGSTGDRLQVFYDATRLAYPQTFPGIHPVTGGWGRAKIALFTTPICSGAVCHMGKTTYENRLSHGGLYFGLASSDRVMSLTRTELLAILADLQRFQPPILRMDPIYAVALIRALEREGLPVPKVEVVWTAYEYCSVLHRPVLERAFGVPVFTLYAATDLGGGCQAFRCEYGRFHVRQNQYVFEFLRGGRPVAPGELGEITVTSLYHRYMPLIRYRVEDLARPFDEVCACSHGDWPAFQIEGRVRDCMLDTSGRIVTTRAFDDLLEGLTWIDFYQMTQRDARGYELLAVRRPGTDEAADEATFKDRARGLLGADAEIKVRYARAIPTERSFKFRLTSSRLFSAQDF